MASTLFAAHGGWSQRPEDGGQIVDIHWTTTEAGAIMRRHDQSCGQVTYTLYDWDYDGQPYEPWNGTVGVLWGTGREISADRAQRLAGHS